MPRIPIVRVIALGFLGAVAGAVALALAYARHPVFALDFDRDLPRLAAGFHPVERSAEATFAWTRDRAAITLRGADRRIAWECGVVFRGGRAAPLPQPLVELGIDGVMLASRVATNEYAEMTARAPARTGRTGLALSLVVSPTFVPGPQDPRELGVQVDRLWCQPVGAGLVLPPSHAWMSASAMGAAMGAAFAVAAATAPAAAGTLAVTALAGLALARDAAPYTEYPGRIARHAAVIGLALVLTLAALTWWRRAGLSATARFAIAFSAAALLIELVGLLHPSKLIVDAVFQAHRLEWVLAGRYFFTQPMPDGVRFPYAIALYLFAAPWTAFTGDYVSLLRIVVAACRAVAGIVLYPLVVRTWGDSRAGVVAVVLLHVVPLPYLIIGNANLTFAFGQSVATIVLAAAAGWRLAARDVGALIGLTALAALAFLSHVGVFPVLMVTLLAMAGLYWWLGGAPLRVPARAVLIAGVAAAVVSVVSYYGRFNEAYQTLERVRARAISVVSPAGDAAAKQPVGPDSEPVTAITSRTLPARVSNGLLRLAGAVGWPVTLLALAGLWPTWRAGCRNRMGLALAAVAVAHVVFLASAVAAPVEPRFERYTDEFLDRLSSLTMPALVLLAGRGVSWSWTAGGGPRLAATALVAAALLVGVREWWAWLQ